MDKLYKGYTEETGLAIVVVDASDTAAELERCHLSGPTAGRVLGESLIAASLLSANLGNPDERITFQLRVDGPVGGVTVDAAHNGDLRGFTHVKILNDLDGEAGKDLSPALGTNGLLNIIQSTGEKVLHSGQVRTEPPEIKSNLALYFNQSLQRKTGVELVTGGEDGHISMARGLTVEKMPDGDTKAFVSVLEKLNAGAGSETLLDSADPRSITDALGLNSVQLREERPLRFACPCSPERILKMVEVLPAEELQDILLKEEDPEVTCHFCGKDYRVPLAAVASVVRSKNT